MISHEELTFIVDFSKKKTHKKTEICSYNNFPLKPGYLDLYFRVGEY